MTWTLVYVRPLRVRRSWLSRSLIRQGNDLDFGMTTMNRLLSLRGGLDPLFVRAMTWTLQQRKDTSVLDLESRSLIRQGNDLDAPNIELPQNPQNLDLMSRSLIRQGNDLDLKPLPRGGGRGVRVSIPYSSGQ